MSHQTHRWATGLPRTIPRMTPVDRVISPHTMREQGVEKRGFRNCTLVPPKRITVSAIAGFCILLFLIFRGASPARVQLDRIPPGKEHVAE